MNGKRRNPNNPTAAQRLSFRKEHKPRDANNGEYSGRNDDTDLGDFMNHIYKALDKPRKRDE